ncbi:MAG TPA: hypothetical protein VNL91_03855 [Thermoanaerobaculia bacterium]|nr:hypothetical protein [Thermoanaerobaculia bacterium]
MRPREHKFIVRHQQKQRLLLRALEQMDTSSETPAESAAITEMIVRLEELISRRQRRRFIGETVQERGRRQMGAK